MLVQELKTILSHYPVPLLKNNTDRVLGICTRLLAWLRDFYVQYKMQSSKLRNHLNNIKNKGLQG